MNLIWLFVCLVIGIAYGDKRVKRQFYPRVVYPNYYHNPHLPYYHDYPAFPHTPHIEAPPPAICKVVPSTGSKVSGELLLRQSSFTGPVLLSGTLLGLEPGLHGFHVHQNGNLTDDCKAAGSHFNPENKTHGAPTDADRHAGDLGNIVVDPHGFANIYILDPEISLFKDHARYIVGRAIVIHEKKDDLGKGGDEESLKTGNAGNRLGCCLIEPVVTPMSVVPVVRYLKK